MTELLTYSLNNIFGFSLVLIRLSGLCVVSPVFGGEQVPKRIRIFFALFMAFAIYPALNLKFDYVPLSLFDYFLIVLHELILGMMIGFLSTALFYGFQMGGRYMAIHMGMSMGRVLDPFSNMQTTVIGQILNFVVLAVFLIINGHHLLLKAVYDSFIYVPPLHVKLPSEAFNMGIEAFNVVVWTSLKIALPTMTALFAINIVFAFVARLVPKMNVFILSMPAKILAGVFIITAAMPAIIILFYGIIEKVFENIYHIIKLCG